MQGIINQPWFLWTLAIVVGFPLLAAVLGQLLATFEKRKFSLATSLWYALNFLLPVAAFFLIFRYVGDASPENVANRTLLTIVLVLLIYVSVAIFNSVFFGAAPPESWRSRTPRLLRDIVLGLMVVVGGGIVASQVWNQNVAGMVTALGIGSVILGFALQETLGNIMLGLSMLMERPYLEGDTIKIGSTEGKVEEINWRATRLSSGADVVIIPHAIAAKEIITNFSRPDPATQGILSLGFGYDHAPNLVKSMLLEIITKIDGVLASPPPNVTIESYGDSAIFYKTSYAVSEVGQKEKVKDSFLTNVWYAGQRAGVSMPYPIRTVYSFDGKETGQRPEQKVLAELRSTALLTGLDLDTATFDAWVKDAKLQHFSAGETIVQQGEQVPNLFIIVAGKAVISCKAADHKNYTLYELARGDFFGETTLLSGADSPYSVRAQNDVEILCLAGTDVNRLIEHQPSLAMEIGQIMDIRRKAVLAANKKSK
jgi:small-conductance mechanosensitive channel